MSRSEFEDELLLKAKVIADLMEQGATEVTIVGTDISVTREDYQQITASPPGQVVNINISAEANIHINQLDAALNELRSSKGLTKAKKSELDKQGRALRKELTKGEPNRTNVRKVLVWALENSWEAFKKLAPIVLEKMG